jgi:hypothetical protein
MWLQGAQGWHVDDAREAPRRSSWWNASSRSNPWLHCQAHKGMATALPQTPPITDVDPVEHDGPPERCPTDAPCAISAFPVARSMPDRSLMRDSIPAAEREDSESLGSHPRSRSRDGGFPASATRDEHNESDDHDGPDASHASSNVERGHCRTEL